MAEVYVNPNKPLAVSLALFKKIVGEEGILKELSKREYALTKSQKKRIKSQEHRRLMKKLKKKRQFKDDNR